MTGERQSCLEVAAIILGAGASTRMGTMKQLLPYRGETLLGYVIDVACEAGFAPIIVVVGAQGCAVQQAIAAKPVEVVPNAAWQSGIGSSIAAGVGHLQLTREGVGAAALLLADQPLVRPEHLREMRGRLYASAAQAVAAEYGGTIGVPAIFARPLFPRLIALPADAGAKHLLLDRDLTVARVALPEAAVDVDTPQDLARLAREPA